MNVRVLKLSSGEEVVGEVEVSENKITVIKPITVIKVPQPDSQTGKVVMQPTVMPWAQSVAGERVGIFQEHIVFNEEPCEELNQLYRQLVTGLVTPPSSLTVV